ncbi:hypothetical protein FB460_1773 [Propioniferax innocua]|uniref:DUF3093 family protein n=1 Tax=Propioniferax innocua TaxID=1753 RepID=A0A542ZC43_9ACTN|nr:hypothetical protein FB460_1773 [Propioniferax innocua]
MNRCGLAGGDYDGPVTIRLESFDRLRFWLLGMCAVVALAAFLWWSADRWHGLGVVIVFTGLMGALSLWALPSDLVRVIELDEHTVTVRRASPTVTSIDRSEVVDAALEGDVLRLELVDGAAAKYPDVLALGLADGNTVRLPLATSTPESSVKLAELVEQIA